ncbi:hypothetical protein V8B97DRAFT_1967163 [Scleroderma yunnanense]
MSSSSELLAIGRQCSQASCLLVDFLPFKCEHCSESFCAEHFTVTAHKCPKYDESKHNRVAPSCPLCNNPVAIPPGQDPNIRMETHISTECSVTTGKSDKAKSTPTCARGKCGKVLFAPISCDTCHKQYCPLHRFPKDHGCTAAASAQPSSSIHQNALSAVLKRATVSTSSPSKISPSKGTSNTQKPSALPKTIPPSVPSTSTPALSNLFSKTDRRAKAERESRRKAMMERAKKGLLTEQEKLMLASEEAERAQGVGSNKDCVIM